MILRLELRLGSEVGHLSLNHLFVHHRDFATIELLQNVTFLYFSGRLSHLSNLLSLLVHSYRF